MITFDNLVFNCPYCEKQYIDNNDKYLNRINKSFAYYTKIKCKCNNWFGVTYDMKGKLHGYKLNDNKLK